MSRNLERDAFDLAVDMMKEVEDSFGRVGFGTAVLFDKHGRVISATPFCNLITDAGDLYYAQKCIVGIAPASPSAPTAVNGMKLGTGATAVTKSGAASFIGTYLSGSNVAFDATYPSFNNLGGGLGVNCVYKTTWAAGVATGTITEAAIVTDQATNTAGAASSTICRSTFTGQPKGASDTFAITWNHKNLGA